MPEKISALIDGELHDSEVGRTLSRIKSELHLREAWDTYHLIGDALRGDLGAGIAPGPFERLREEPVVFAPRRAAARTRELTWYALSAAASLAAIALVAWMALPAPNRDPGPQLAASQPAAKSAAGKLPGPAVEAGSASATAQAGGGAARPPAASVENYLLAHQPFSSSSAMQGVAPYVRLVAEEREPSAP